MHIRIEQDCYLRGKTPKTENSRSLAAKWREILTDSARARFANSSLSLAFCCSRQISGKKIQPFSLFWVPLFTWNLFGSWNARFANSPTQLPLKSSVHTHAWNLIAWNCGVGFDFTEKLFVTEEKSRLGGFVRPTCYLKSTAPYWAEVQFTQTDQYWLSMNLPRFRFMGPDEKASFSFLNDFTLRLSWFRDGRP